MSDHDIGSSIEPLKSPFTLGSGAGAPRACNAGGAPSADSAPHLLKGGETSTPIAIIDWLAFTAPERKAEGLSSVFRFLNLAFGGQVATLEKRQHGLFGYTDSWAITLPVMGESQVAGVVACGGSSQKHTFFISLTGVACARIVNWQRVHNALVSMDATITRADVAHDDLVGQRTIEDMLALYHVGAFNSGGRKPKCKVVGDWINNDGDGRTLYFGSRQAGKFCRVYEKGRQLGDRDSPWIRVEVEIRKKDRLIPHDIVLKPGKYLAGCYPALAFLSDTAARIKTNRKGAKVSLDRLIDHASLVSGRTINAMTQQGYDPHEIVSLLLRPGLPKRLIPHEAVMEQGTIYAFGDDHGDA